jgi:hypothetical protein
VWRFPAERTIKSRSVAFQVETLCYNGQWACLFFVDCSLVRNSLFLYIKRCRAYQPRQLTSKYPASSFTPTHSRTRSRSSHTPTFFHTHTRLPTERFYTLIPIPPRSISNQQERIRKHNNKHAFLYYLRRRPFFRWIRFGNHLEERYHQERSVRL